MLNENPEIPAGIIYTACVLHKNSQIQLLSLAEKWLFDRSGAGFQPGWVKRAHHMTIKFRPSNADVAAIYPMLGKEVKLHVTDFAADKFGIAVVVKPEIDLPIGQVPHITVAHSKEVSPVYSNSLLANRANISPLPAETVLVGFLVAVLGNSGTFPDLSPIPLAAG